ncbi:hypothetical protein BAC3_01420 [uncultured bacterium]|nr:hypothetical protein BAC3_01420 [uncultured bacterium]
MKKILIATAISVLTACTSVTDIDATWKKPNVVAQKYQQIVVLGLSKDLAKRSAVETSIVNNLAKNGYHAVAGSNILPEASIDVNQDGKLDAGVREQLVEKLKASGIDGALVFTLNDIQKSSQYVPPTVDYMPPVGMGRFGGYYGAMYDGVYGGAVVSPGYYVENSDYVMTTNFYNVADESLLWSTQSGTKNPSSVSDFATSFGEAVVKTFIESGVAGK